MSNNDGLINSYLLDGKGGGRHRQWDEINRWQTLDGVLWTHLDYTHDTSRNWIHQQSNLGDVAAEALLAEETRPRAADVDGGLLLILRGVNLNPGADPEDMVAIRVWTDGKRIISTCKRSLVSVADLGRAIEQGHGPQDVADFLVMLTNGLSDRADDVIEEVCGRMDDLEEQVLKLQSHQLRPVIANIQREAIALRRYLAPQRDALSRLYSERVSWLHEMDRMRLRESADQVTRLLEELDSVRERAIVAQQELMSRLSEHMEKRMYVLSLVAAIFLPLGFLTGLLGINVAGIPGAENEHAFALFSLLLIIIVIAQLLLFRYRKWI